MVKKLLNMGFKPLTGIYYLADAIEIKNKNPFESIGNIYVSLAKKYNVKLCTIERNIRTVIQISDTKYKKLSNNIAINTLLIEMKE